MFCPYSKHKIIELCAEVEKKQQGRLHAYHEVFSKVKSEDVELYEFIKAIIHVNDFNCMKMKQMKDTEIYAEQNQGKELVHEVKTILGG